MKDIQEFNSLKSYAVTVNPDLDKYENMPLFQEKKDKVGLILEKKSTQALIKEIKDERIKRYFEQNMPIEQIAKRVSLPKAEVLSALEEMGLIEPVND
jgi:folate-dependent tRNA-U54 methylase TrmFO/GidA